MKRVEGYNNLYRNESGAIVNTDSSAYQAYKRKKSKIKAKDSSLNAMSKELQEAKDEIEELKALIKDILNK